MRPYLLVFPATLALLSGAPRATAADAEAQQQPPAQSAGQALTAVEPSPDASQDPGHQPEADTQDQGLPGAESPSSDMRPDRASSTDLAVQRAQRALFAAEEASGVDAPELVAPLDRLAVAQLEAGEYAAAADTLRRQVDLLEKLYGVYDMRIARPLSLLGEAQTAAGLHKESVATLQRAQHLVHRADGVYSLQQLEYLEKISRNFVAMNQLAEADRHHRFSFFVSERKYGPESKALVPSILRLAEWYRRVGNVRDARKLYERAIGVIERAEGKQHPDLIEPLLGLGITAQKKSQYRRQRENALRRMVAIVEAHPQLDTVDRAASWAHLGDFYTMINKDSHAADAYQKGWGILEADTSLPEYQSGLFAEPKILNFPKRIYLMDHTPGTPLTGFDMSLEEYELEVEFEVSIGADGRVLKVRAINLNASPTTRRQIRRYVREARFRPRIVDGKPVRTDGFRLKEKLTVVRPKV